MFFRHFFLLLLPKNKFISIRLNLNFWFFVDLSKFQYFEAFLAKQFGRLFIDMIRSKIDTILSKIDDFLILKNLKFLAVAFNSLHTSKSPQNVKIHTMY